MRGIFGSGNGLVDTFDAGGSGLALPVIFAQSREVTSYHRKKKRKREVKHPMVHRVQYS
jgi:hypothetical protein